MRPTQASINGTAAPTKRTQFVDTASFLPTKPKNHAVKPLSLPRIFQESNGILYCAFPPWGLVSPGFHRTGFLSSIQLFILSARSLTFPPLFFDAVKSFTSKADNAVTRSVPSSGRCVSKLCPRSTRTQNRATAFFVNGFFFLSIQHVFLLRSSATSTVSTQPARTVATLTFNLSASTSTTMKLPAVRYPYVIYATLCIRWTLNLKGCW